MDDRKLDADQLGENINLQFVETALLTTENYNDRNWLTEIVEEHEPIEFPVFRCPYCEELGRGMKGYLVPPKREQPIQLYQFRDGWKMSGARFKAQNMKDSHGYTTAEVRDELVQI